MVIPAELLRNNGYKRRIYNKKPVKRRIADRRYPPQADKFDFFLSFYGTGQKDKKH